ncbi:restriction endonuclease subunit S [Rhodoferax aquaticus]|uniref:Restriction endonuclease subunit S n=1 Tax=Rhodoferax aquaticus TaxID=2527691 RepID=A0A515EQR1_9BURK|nr:restriction endonuclease subunit S [Rhodoferax aquaticus]QDL54996.1 restriction endonuclease subunit S [Rhodoferax aquaticus]
MKNKKNNSVTSWIETIPLGWSVARVKDVVKTKVTDGPHETPVFVDESEGVPFVSAEAVSSGKLNFEKVRGYISHAEHRRFSRKFIPKRNDIFIVKSGATTGVAAFVDTDRIFNIWSPLAALRCNGDIVNPRFGFHFVSSSIFRGMIEYYWSFGTQQNIGMGVLEKLYIPLPPLPEQITIADYLDKTTALIDKQRALLERKKALLQEHKKSLIHEAVTKGLDSSVPMKASGVDWIGDVPNGWEIGRLKDVTKVGAGNPAPLPDLLSENESDVPFLRVSDLSSAKNGFCSVSKDKVKNPENLGLKVWKAGTFVFPKSGESIRSNVRAVLARDMAVVSHLACVINRKNLNTRLCFWLLNSLNFESKIIQTALPALGLKVIQDYEIALPPMPEQVAIAEYLDRATELVDRNVRLINRKLDALTQLRTSVIHEAVTKGVPSYAQPQQEAA